MKGEGEGAGVVHVRCGPLCVRMDRRTLRARTPVTRISTSARANWQYSAKSRNSCESVPLSRKLRRSSEQTSSAQSAPKLAAMPALVWLGAEGEAAPKSAVALGCHAKESLPHLEAL